MPMLFLAPRAPSSIVTKWDVSVCYVVVFGAQSPISCVSYSIGELHSQRFLVRISIHFNALVTLTIMPEQNPSIIFDGYVNFLGGVNQRHPSTILPNQFSAAINTTCRDGYPHPRPGYNKLDLDFQPLTLPNELDPTDPIIEPPEVVRARFEDGLFQGASFYTPGTGEPFIMASIGGRLYKVAVWSNPSVSEQVIAGNWNSSILPKAWFVQAQQFMLVQDNQSSPIIFDGAVLRRATTQEIPTGNVMAYGNGRIWVALSDYTSFLAGDIVYGNGQESDVLKVTENTFLAGGGVFAVPSNLGGITGMKFLANIDTSLGQGPLQVFTPSAVFSVNSPVDRTVWQNLQYPIQTISQLTNGALSDRAISSVNSDVFYRSMDGIRSFFLSRRDFQRWKDKPVSREIQRVLRADGTIMLAYASSVVFDNRFLVTTVAENVQGHGIAWKALAVMDLDPLSSLIEDEPPIWEGLWTGVRILQLVHGFYQGEERLFAFVLNSLNQIEVWEITKRACFDNGTDRIPWVIETRAFKYIDPFENKKIQFLDTWHDDIRGEVDFRLLYRPNQYPCWYDWEEWTECAENEICQPDDGSPCITIKNLQPQYRLRHRSFMPTFAVDPSSREPALNGTEFQIRLEVTGCARLLKLRLASQLLETDTASSRQP